MELTIWLAAAAGAGFGLALVVGRFSSRRSREQADQRSASVMDLAKREAELVVKETRSKLQLEIDERRAQMERDAKRMELEIEVKLKEFKAHEESLAALDHDLRLRETNIEAELEEVKASRRNFQELSDNVRRTMANLASMDVNEIKAELRRQVQMESAEELKRLRKDEIERSEHDIARQAKAILITAMQRLASKPNNEVTATIVQLPNDDMKGRIIGRDGRNIKCFETATGTTLLIDESPNMVLISSFDPVRREIAKAALDRLVADGRIHPATIEEFVQEARNDIDKIVASAGEAAVAQLKLSRLHPEAITLLGKLKFRSSYSQNVLEHSVEVAYLCSLIASELGLDPHLAKRAGLLHDIGKAIDGEREGSHAIAGAEFMRERGEDAIVVNAVAAHHYEVDPTSLYAGLVILADTISATRPGARAESMASYIDRLKNLEDIAYGFNGVKSAFAIHAGREIRVVVDPEGLADDEAKTLASRIRERIEDELEYPSAIRIIVIREQRFVETAK